MQNQLDQKLDATEREFSQPIYDLLGQVNETRLKNAGDIAKQLVRDRYSLRWVMKWQDSEEISYELNIVIRVEDTGSEARVSGIWVRRHAATLFDFDGDTPTTHMRRVTDISIQGIRAAVEAELG